MVLTGQARYSDKLQNKKKHIQLQQQRQQQQQQQKQQQHHQSFPEGYDTIARSSKKPQKVCSGGEGNAPPKKAQVRT